MAINKLKFISAIGKDKTYFLKATQKENILRKHRHFKRNSIFQFVRQIA